MNQVTEKIEEEIKRRGWSKYRLSMESGVPYNTIRNLFSRGNAPTWKTLNRICGALNLSVSELYDGGVPKEERKKRQEICSLQREITDSMETILSELEDLKGKVERLNELCNPT